ncbi:MAG: hypothetical protein QM754_15105 [Tepidisphaeraceae bacterium]
MRKTLAAAAVLVTAGLLWAATGKPGVVRTHDGAVYDGLVDEQDSNVTVNVRGIDTTIARENIASITYGDFEQRWTDDYAKLGEKDVDGRLAAARRAFDNRRYDLAEKAARDAQGIDPNSAAAADLLRLTQSQRRLERTQQQPGNTADRTPVDTPEIKPVGQWNTLSSDDINRIKQIEVRETETRMRFSFANNVLKRFYDATPDLSKDYPNFASFRSAAPVTQALRIIKQGSADMAKDVRVASDPESIVAFRRDAMPLILQGCATSLCHGGNNAASAKFALLSPASDASIVYTNFYILQTAGSKKTGDPVKRADGSVEAPPPVAMLIDRMRPEQSLVLQYGLSEQSAQMKHPHVQGYNGIYPRGRDDAKYKAITAFISSLSPVKPEYNIDFKLARKDGTPGPAATQP